MFTVISPLNVMTRVVIIDNTERLMAQFTCDKGFLYGAESLVCEKEDTWSGDPPFCVIMSIIHLQTQFGQYGLMLRCQLIYKTE